MKKHLLILPFLLFLFSTLTAANSKNEFLKKDLRTVEFMVYGNCDMCKMNIEQAVASVKGVKAVKWNQETKMIKLSYDANKVSLDDIKKEIAKSGYNTNEFRADTKDYEALHPCCQSERPE